MFKYLLPLGIIAIIIIAFYDTILTGLIWFGIGLAVFGAGAGMITLYVGWQRALVAREQFKSIKLQSSLIVSNGDTWVRQETTKSENGKRVKSVEYVRLGGPRLRVNGHDHELTQAEWLYWQAQLSNGQTKQNQMMLPAQIEAPLDLMSELRTAQRVLIKAASNGGKTTLLQHIAAQRIAINESVLILDSQSYPDKWPAGCKVVGAGSNHQAISVALDGLIDLMVKRYQEIGQGLVREGQHPKLTIIIDEWMAIVGECDNAGDVIRRLLTESRKAAFSVFIGSHSERVKALGLDGRGDLRDGFLIVRIEMENGQRMATIATGKGERPCVLPGEYIASRPGNVFEIEAIEVAQPTTEEQRVLDMLDDDESLRAITQAVWGQRGAFYNSKVEAIAKKYGREVRTEARSR